MGDSKAQESPTPSSLMEQIDTIFRNLLGEYHDHKCGCGRGCINCRNTGLSQSPCLICDKDGIAFKKINEAKAAVTIYIEAATLEARSDELIQMCRKYRQRPIPERAMLDRIKELIDPKGCTGE